MNHHVIATLFLDSAHALKLRDDVDWPTTFHSGGLPLSTQKVSREGWVPMETFERIALAFLSVEGAKPNWFRTLGSHAVDRLIDASPALLVPGDPRETVTRFLLVRQSFFDFPVLDVTELTETQARIDLHYGLCPTAEHAAAVSTAGFLCRPLDLCGATRVRARLIRRSWAGDSGTTLALDWQPWPLH